MPTDDVVPIVADDLRAAVDNDAVHRNSGGDRPVPSRVELLVQVVHAIPENVQHGLGGQEGSMGQEVPTTLNGSG